MLKILMKLAGAVMILAAIVSCKEEKEDFGVPNIGVNTSSVNFSEAEGQQTVKILSSRDWTAEIDYAVEVEDDWLVVTPASGSASHDSVEVVLSVLANSAEDRSASVTFNAGALSATVSVFQKGEVAKEYDAIEDVRALYQGENVTISEDWTICGTVISNYRHSESGGLNNATSQKSVVIQDETAGIVLYLAENNKELALGDRIEVKVNGLVLQRFDNGSLQIDAVPMDRITKITTGSQVEPKTISASELVTGEYESQYVAVTDVQVVDSDLGKTFVTQDGEGKDRHTSINFISRTGVRFLLFSSAYSTFGDQPVPEGSGTLKGIAAVHGGDYQISITSTDDYAELTGERFDNSGFERPQPTKATIAEVLAASVSGSVWYEITGTISNIEASDYGNFTITDETGSIYVYGLTSEWRADGKNDQSFPELGLKAGDILTLAGTRDEYKDEPQIGGPAYYISHKDGGGEDPDPDEPGDLVEVTIEEFLEAQPGDGVWYQLTGEVYDIYNTSFGNFWIRDDAGNQVRVYGLTSTKQESNDHSFESIGLSEGDIVTIATLRAEHNGEAQAGGTPPAYYISHEEGEEPDVPAGDPTALIISEYVEGSGSNKFIEVANVSDSEIDLSAYTLVKYTNGDENKPDAQKVLSGTLAPGAVKVYGNSQADLTLPAGVEFEVDNNVINFNGNDPMAIICNGEVIDLLGEWGADNWGENMTLRRKSTVTAPSATYNPDEWDVLEQNDVSGLGTL
jgi:hypothetical protein